MVNDVTGADEYVSCTYIIAAKNYMYRSLLWTSLHFNESFIVLMLKLVYGPSQWFMVSY